MNVPAPSRFWRFLDTGPGDAAWNMAVDEAVFHACRRKRVPPTVRVYAWRPPAVSLGYAQRLHEELDPARCRRYGIDVVRRHTGGRAVLHDQELTYSFIAPEGHPQVGANGYDHYRLASLALLDALAAVGIEAELVPTREAMTDGAGGVCFTHAARYEVVVRGRKIVGSAQRRAGGMVLQHGSLLLGPAHKRLPLLLPVNQHERRSQLMNELDRRTISVAELLGDGVSYKEMAGHVKIGFQNRLRTVLQTACLTEDERREAGRLVETKYGMDEWNVRRKTTPAA